jgi:mRNA interferase HicA
LFYDSLGKERGVAVHFVARRGKGSHGTPLYGTQFTIVPNLKNELKTGTLHEMLTQLGLRSEEL